MNLDNLTLKEKVGQKFIFGVYSENVEIIVDLIKECHIGGVILYKKNYKNYDEMLSVIKKFKDANKNNKIPLFIAIDQEGGRVNRMPVEFKNLKNIYDMSSRGESLVIDASKITAKMLKDTGINMNFAPVMDIYDGGSKVLFKRCFNGLEDDIYNFSKIYIENLSSNGIVPVIKHFPGHGATKMDSHFLTPYVFNYEGVLNKHIVPFEKVINDNIVDAIMVNHMVIRKLTKGFPASISASFIDDYIRMRNNYDGLIITDEMNMLSKNIFYKFNYLKKLFLTDNDLILVKIKSKKEAIKLIDTYLKFIESNDTILNIDRNVSRIINIKNKYNISDNDNGCGCNIDLVNSEIDRINNLCDCSKNK